MTSLNKARFQKKSYYEIGPTSWIKKMISTSTLQRYLVSIIISPFISLSKVFCNAIGLREPCMITLKTSMDSTESWQVYSNTIKDCRYLLSQGWKRFCQDNSLKEGDLCTFYVVETTLWHVVITRCKEKVYRTRCIFEIGPPAWMKKEMNTSTIERVFLSMHIDN
nr:unnamed protein product [Digitaria exilis]